MTNITDNPPFGAPRQRPRIVEHADRLGVPIRHEPMFEAHTAGLTDAMRRAAAPQPAQQDAYEPDPLLAPLNRSLELTYLESIAKRLLWLPYGDMVEMCEAIMAGDKKPATGDELARLIHEWAKTIEAKAIGKGETA